jgi:hypothetical protein
VHSLRKNCHLFPFGLTLALLGAATLSHASPPQATPPQAENAQDVATQESFKNVVNAQRAAIDRENSTTPSVAWAGDYYSGDGLGANVSLSLAPHAGVAATWG